MLSNSYISSQTGLGEVGLLWVCPNGDAMPALIGELATATLSVDVASQADLVFAPLCPNDPQAIVALRAEIGDAIHLVAVIADHRSMTTEARAALFASGIDDCLDPSDPADIQSCVPRALANARRTKALRNKLAATVKDCQELQNSIDSLPSPIFFKDRDSIYQGCNRAFGEFVGRTREEIVGARATDITSPKTADIFQQADLALLAGGGIQVYETDIEHADGTHHHVTFYKTLVFSENGEAHGIAGAMVDITDRKLLEDHLREAAERDFLTGLFNRRHFLRAAEDKLDAATAESSPIFVAIADIDRFKRFNDCHGHACGDDVLRHVAATLSLELEPDHLVARCGGEEFYLLLNCQTEAEAFALLEDMRVKIAKSPIRWGDEKLRVTLSMGLATTASSETDILHAIARADEALYSAKHCGRNRVEIAAAPQMKEKLETEEREESGGYRRLQSSSRASEGNMIGMPSRIGKASLAALDTNSLLSRS